jgi:hypothetical protein
MDDAIFAAFMVAPDEAPGYGRLRDQPARIRQGQKPPLPKICRFIPYSELKREIEQIGGRIRYMKPEFISEIAENCEPEYS